MNNMDDFFKKRLSDFRESSDGWNIPADEIWEKSSEYFPKPKKKKRRFIFFFLAISLVISTLLTYPWSVYENNPIESDDSVSVVKIEKEKGVGQMAPELESTKSTQNADQLFNLNSTQESTSIDDTDQSTNSNKINNTRTSNSIIIGSTNLNQNGNTIRAKENELKNNPTESGAKLSTTPSQKNGDLDENSVNQLHKDNRTTNENIFVNHRFDKKKLENTFHTEGLQTPTTSIVSVTNISKIGFQHTAFKNKIPGISKFLPLTIDLKNEDSNLTFKHELGLSYSISPFAFIKELDISEGQSQYEIFPEFDNINLHYSRPIKSRWRFSTGAYLSRIKLHMDFHQFFTYEEDLMTESITTEYGNALDQSSANESGTVAVTFVKGKEPFEGEELNIKGGVDITLKALQVPIFFTHHWLKNDFEFYLGGGPTLELVSEGQSNGDLDVFRIQDKISSTSEIIDINETYTDYSIYGLVGFKYHLNKRINLGLNLKLNISEPIFSTSDLGVFYRW